ncbi:hypothetical protein MHYP_G00273890 [Metynnis hypsauchen]
MSSQKTRESERCAFTAPQPQEADQHRSEMKGTNLGTNLGRATTDDLKAATIATLQSLEFVKVEAHFCQVQNQNLAQRDESGLDRGLLAEVQEQSAELREVNPATFQVMRRGTQQAARRKPLSLQRRGLRWDEPGYLFIRMT